MKNVKKIFFKEMINECKNEMKIYKVKNKKKWERDYVY